MKKVSIVSLLALIMGLISIFVTSAFTPKKEQPLYIAPSLAILDHFAGEPVHVFELMADASTKIVDIKAAAAKVGINVANVPAVGGVFRQADVKPSDPSAHFEYDPQKGNLTFSQGIGEQLRGGINLPTTSNADVLATDFLKSTRMMPADERQLVTQHIGGIKRVTKEGETDVLKTATYTRKINGIPVSGSGSKIVLELGNNGKVLSMQRKWREINASNARAYPQVDPNLKSQPEAEKEFAQLVRDIFGNVPYQVQSVQKMYYDNGEKYIQPVFLFEANITIQEKQKARTIPFVQPISLLRNAPEPIGFNVAKLKEAATQSSIQYSGKKPVSPTSIPKR